MILAATVNSFQLDQVEQATKIQFPNDEIRNHDDRTGKYHNDILGGAVNEDDDHLSKNEEGQENNGEDLDALATAQAEALASLATSRMLARINIRYGCHVVTLSSGTGSTRSSQQEARTNMRHLQQPTRRTANLQLLCTETSLFAGEALETGKALIDCGATRSVASWEALDGLARMKQQRHGSTCFFWMAHRRRGTLLQMKKEKKETSRSR